MNFIYVAFGLNHLNSIVNHKDKLVHHLPAPDRGYVSRSIARNYFVSSAFSLGCIPCRQRE